MEPNITKAEVLLSFDLAPMHKAGLYGDVESEGIIQYNHILVVFGTDGEPCLYVCAEWSALDPTYREETILGMFHDNGHDNMGGSADWRDEHLFLLRAVELAREHLGIAQGALTLGEAWALSGIMKRLMPQAGVSHEARSDEAYWSAISRYDLRLVDFFQEGKPTESLIS